MAILGNVEILVKPEELSNSAGIVSGYLKNMQEYFDTIEETIQKTTSYWIGEAADYHRNMYSEQKDTIVEIMARLNEHPRDLVQMAGIYDSVERDVTAMSLELPGDVID